MACSTPLSLWIGKQIGPWFSLGTSPPKTKLIRGVMITPSLRKLWFSETTHFLKSTQMALESSKIDIFHKWPEQVLGYVSRSLVSKFEPKSPKGSVPNGQSYFVMRDSIRWFKCKLKPPKNSKCQKLLDQLWLGNYYLGTSQKVYWNIFPSLPKYGLKCKIPITALVNLTFEKLALNHLVKQPSSDISKNPKIIWAPLTAPMDWFLM